MANITEGGIGRFVVVGAFLLVCAPVFAAPYTTIRTPPAAAIASLASEGALHQLVLANLVASNCNMPDLTAGDAGLLAGTAQTVAEYMKIGTERYFSDYVQPAMARLATPDACNTHAGATRDMLESVKALGGAILDQ